MSTFLTAIEYFNEHEAHLNSTLDELIDTVNPGPGDIPAFTFAGLVEIYSRDPGRAVTLAAFAIMRLAETKAADASEPTAGSQS